MKTLLPVILCALLAPLMASAEIEDDFRKTFEDFKQQSAAEFETFRAKINMEFADFLQQKWEEYGLKPAVARPKEKRRQPVKLNPKAIPLFIPDHPITIKDVILPPAPLPLPVPLILAEEDIDTPIENVPVKDKPIEVTPIENRPIVENKKPIENNPRKDIVERVPVHPGQPEKPIESEEKIAVLLYGTDMSVRRPDGFRVSVRPDERSVAQAWRKLSGTRMDATLRDCLDLRDKHSLSDWAYLRLLDAVADQMAGKDTNESELVKAYLFSQSGYKMRLAFSGKRLVMLYSSPYIIYGKPWWDNGGNMYYCDLDGVTRLSISKASFPGERPMTLAVRKPQRLLEKKSPARMLRTSGGEVCVESDVNVNDIEFCNDFPSSQYGDNPISRWAIYANTPASEPIRKKLYPQLRKAIEGRSTYDAVNSLCRWVQTAFQYEMDDKVWGGDRAFFADETLYYPYSDCEDRSILLTRIVRDLLNLPCALVYYPGHLATAIAVGEDASGDYIRVEGKKFLICDPTYINAPIGLTMPGLDNESAEIMMLE